MEPENNMENKAPENTAPEITEMAAEEVVVTETKPVAEEAPKDMPKGDIVFNNKPKKKTGMILCIILLLLIAAGGVGFGVWAWMDGNSQRDSLNAQINSLKEQNSKLMSEFGDMRNDDVIVNVDTDAWDNFSDNLAKNNSTTVSGYYYHWNGSENERRSVNAEIKNAHLTITGMDQDDYGVIFAEVDDVISAYYVTIGNGDIPYIYIIKKDGGVARVEISKDAIVENLDGYREIVSVINGNDLNAWLIDINGNIYKSS